MPVTQILCCISAITIITACPSWLVPKEKERQAEYSYVHHHAAGTRAFPAARRVMSEESMRIVICSEAFGIDSDPITFEQNTLEIKIRINEQLYQGSKLPLHLRRDLFAKEKNCPKMKHMV